MGLTLVSAPAVEPLTVAEVRAHLRRGASDGEPAPQAPTVALAGAGAGGLSAGAYRYRVTFVTADGETDGGDISDTVTVATPGSDGQVAVTAIPTGGAAVTARRLYRTTAGGSSFLRLTTLADNTTTSYTDTVADGALGVAVPTQNTTEDPELVALIATARYHAELYTGRAFITQTWDWRLDGFPVARGVYLPKAPVQSVTSVTYVDPTGTTRTWDSAEYLTDLPVGPHAQPARLALADGVSWPSTESRINAVTVRLVAGYGSTGASVPSPIRSAMKLLIGHWYATRTAAQGPAMTDVPHGVDALLWPFKVWQP